MAITKDDKTTKPSKQMSSTHDDFVGNKEVTVTKESLEYREQMREAVKNMNIGQVFIYVDDKFERPYSFNDKKSGELREGISYVFKMDMPVIGLVEIKDKNLYPLLEKGKSYIATYRLENKKSNNGTFIGYSFLEFRHLPQFDKKISSVELMGKDLSMLEF